MFMSFFLIFISCFLYWLLKPPVPYNSIAFEEIVFQRNSSQNSEGVAGCLISKHSIP